MADRRDAFDELVALAPACHPIRYRPSGLFSSELNREPETEREHRCVELYRLLQVDGVRHDPSHAVGDASTAEVVWIRAQDLPDKGFARSSMQLQPQFPALDGRPRDVGVYPYEYGYRDLGDGWYLYVVNPTDN